MKYRHIACFKIQAQETFLWKNLNTKDVAEHALSAPTVKIFQYAVEGIMKIILVIVHCNFL